MEFYAMLDQVVGLLRQRGRVSYRALKLQFALDDNALEAVKAELIEAQQLAMDAQGSVLVWTGPSAIVPLLTRDPAATPLSYTPLHLAEKILTLRHVLAGERKQVTVLVVDVQGSLEALADRDPEEVRALLDPVCDRLLAAVHRCEGTVTRVQGDGLMALFGAPLAHEDHALRACYAALAMHEAIRSYSTEARRTHGIEVQLRVGLQAGEVVVRSIDDDLHMDYAALGTTLSLATRLQQLAPPGSTRLTAETLRLVEGLIQVTPLGPMPMPGLSDPVEVFELVGAGPIRRRLQAAVARGLTHFVGRQHELEALRQALERAGAGHGQVGALVGEPGVGKSRLVYEFTHSHRTQGWLTLESSSVSYGKATPYFPVMDLLQLYFQIETRDDGRRIREKITGKLLTLDPALGPTLPAFLALLDVRLEDSQWQALDPSQRRQRTLEAITGLLLRESQEQPVLLVFEDLHWIDTETQGLLDTLVERLPSARLLLLVNYRPEYQPSWGARGYYTQLRIEPLPPASAEVLLRALLGEDDSLAPLTPLLIARTAGNPFFLEESVRTLVEMGLLHGARGAYRLTQPLVSLQVPATVQAMLAARMDRLPPEAKHLLQTAAVIGHEVPLTLLRAMAAGPEVAFQRALTHLQTAEFLDETRLFPEVEYAFKHALTHEVAYGSLLQERRRTLHTQIVEALEQLAPDHLPEQIDRLAHHAIRGEMWDKALRYCRQAGLRAAKRSAFREAAAAFEQALAALAQLPECRDTLEQGIDLRFDLRASLQALGELARIPSCLHEAETLAVALNDQRRLGYVYTTIGQYYWLIGDQERSIELTQRAITIAEALGDVDTQVRATYYLGTAYHTLGDYPRALDYLRRAVACVAREPFWKAPGSSGPTAVVARLYLGRSLAEVGAFAEGSAMAAEALRIAEDAEVTFSRIAAYFAVGLIALRQGELDRASAMLERGLELCRSAHMPYWFPRVGSVLGYAYALTGRVAEGLPLLEQAVAQGVAMGQMVFQPLWVACLAEAYLVAGRREDAIVHGERALALARTHQERGHEAYVLRLLGEIAAQRTPPEVEPAAAAYREALALAGELGMRPLQAHCHLGLGTLYARIGQPEQARAALSSALALYRAMEMRFWLPPAEAALAHLA